jgi:hypothetical protein
MKGLTIVFLAGSILFTGEIAMAVKRKPCASRNPCPQVFRAVILAFFVSGKSYLKFIGRIVECKADR